MILSGKSTQKLGLLCPFVTVIFDIVFITGKMVNADEAHVVHQTLLSLGLFVPHGHVWWQARKKLGHHNFDANDADGEQGGDLGLAWLLQTEVTRITRVLWRFPPNFCYICGAAVI